MKKTLDVIDDALIVNFREKVNSNSYFILHKYKNIENKNRWNIICSCMDWISVAVRTISRPVRSDKNEDIFSMDVYSYISKIHIITEAITQLHRVLISNKTTPFQQINKIFKNNDLNKDDNAYFEHIRAIFGAHPVNISHSKNKGAGSERWFASWPVSFGEYDLEVVLYSNVIEKDDLVFGIMLDELEEFLHERYSYLKILTDEIDKQFKQYCIEKKNCIIKKDNNIVSQLKILKEESLERLNNDYYEDTINSLLIIFETNSKICENSYVIKYKELLKKLILELYINLQNMNIVDLENHSLISPDYPTDISYEVSKFLVCLSLNESDPLFLYYIKRINSHSNNEIILYETDSNEELYLKVKVLLYFNLWK